MYFLQHAFHIFPYCTFRNTFPPYRFSNSMTIIRKLQLIYDPGNSVICGRITGGWDMSEQVLLDIPEFQILFRKWPGTSSTGGCAGILKSAGDRNRSGHKPTCPCIFDLHLFHETFARPDRKRPAESRNTCRKETRRDAIRNSAARPPPPVPPLQAPFGADAVAAQDR